MKLMPLRQRYILPFCQFGLTMIYSFFDIIHPGLVGRRIGNFARGFAECHKDVRPGLTPSHDRGGGEGWQRRETFGKPIVKFIKKKWSGEFPCYEQFYLGHRVGGFTKNPSVNKSQVPSYLVNHTKPGTGGSASRLTAVKREKFAKNKRNTAKERLSLSLFRVWYLTNIPFIY